MSSRNRGNSARATRNKSKARNDKQGAVSAASHSLDSTHSGQDSLSKACVGDVPSKNQNEVTTEGVNTLVNPDTASSSTLTSEQNKLSDVLISNDTSPVSFEENRISVEISAASTGLAALTEKGDNREVCLQTDFPLEFQSLLVQGALLWKCSRN